MRKFSYLLSFLTLLSFTSKASAQGVAYHDIALYNSNGNARVVASALITVCASGWTSPPPCAPPLGGTLFKDFALLQPLSNPLNADVNGNFNFITPTGNYTVCITGAGVSGTCSQITQGGGGGGTIGGSIAANQVAVGSGLNSLGGSNNLTETAGVFNNNGNGSFTNPIPATGYGTATNSPLVSLTGQAWNGAASVADSYTFQNILSSAGSSQIATLTFSHPTASSAQRIFNIDSTFTFANIRPSTEFSSQTLFDNGITSSASSYDGTVYNLASVGNAAAGLTTYSAATTFLPALILVGSYQTIAGFTNAGNNGRFLVQSVTNTTITVYNSGGVAETHAATTTSDQPYGGGNGTWKLYTPGAGTAFPILGTFYNVATTLSVFPNQVNLNWTTESNSVDAGYTRIINNGLTGPTGDHGFEIGGISDGTGAAPSFIRMGHFGGVNGIFGAFAGGTVFPLPQEICSGQIALTTGAINANTRATNTLACAGLSASTDSISCSFSGDTNAVVGYTPGGGIALKPWVSVNTINVDQQNTTGASITPGAATINCKGLR